ncbi:MAG: hypothetical protein A2341_03190 [Deltaproteobacteria bacterium RIFOXYB12_FULL_58_9]|nr:MAG: hypothetical protein A2341_03190 [Deltaproteobacteria bacterium RIFOXYB12_FULL_58_9]
MIKYQAKVYLEEARDPDWEVPSPKTRRSKGYEWIIPDPNVAIPLMIRQARQKLGVSQRELTRRLDISLQQIQKLETPANPTLR